MNKRKLLLSIYGQKYRRHREVDRHECFYCAEPANQLDHVPPLSWIENYNDKERKKMNIPARLIPCCGDCNRALSSKKLPTVFERLEYLESYYEKKFMSKSSLWTDAEIKQLGRGLKEAVKANKKKFELYKHQIRRIQARLMMAETFPKWDDIDEDSVK